MPRNDIDSLRSFRPGAVRVDAVPVRGIVGNGHEFDGNVFVKNRFGVFGRDIDCTTVDDACISGHGFSLVFDYDDTVPACACLATSGAARTATAADTAVRGCRGRRRATTATDPRSGHGAAHAISTATATADPSRWADGIAAAADKAVERESNWGICRIDRSANET
jgi:hypothetical protein